MPIGKIVKKMDMTISTHKKEVDEVKLRDMKLRKVQNELELLK